MSYCITTGYALDAGIPHEVQLATMRDAGFEYIHWAFEMGDDVVYGSDGIAAHRAMLERVGLKLANAHSAVVQVHRDYGPDPADAARGFELDLDRLRLTAACGGDLIVLHSPEPDDQMHDNTTRMIDAMAKLVPEARRLGVKLAIENIWPDWRNREAIPRILDAFPPDVVGYCFDAGHANIAGDFDWLVKNAFPRLIWIHLHDNDSTTDQHFLPGDGTIDWDKMRGAIVDAGYTKVWNLELAKSARYPMSELEYLKEAYRRAAKYFPSN